jgi:hypothetical protein
MMHQLITEKKGKFRCIYCGRRHNMDNWKSEFTAHKHYKTIRCSCGKMSRIRVVDGSGHDEWSKLEKKVRKEEK